MKEDIYHNNHQEYYEHPEFIEEEIQDSNSELLESIKKSPSEQKDIYRLAEVFQALFGTEYLGDYCCYTDERKQCSDGSDLYTIIKYEGRDLIVKVGAGEFNTKVFTTGNIKELKWFYHSPIPLFVVNQGESYLGNEEHKFLRAHKSRKYLDDHAVIVSPKWGEAYYRNPTERHKTQIDYTHIHIKDYEDALLQARQALLQKEFPGNEFDIAVKMLKYLNKMDFEQFYKQIRKGRKFLSEDMERLIGCLRNMGANRLGSGIGDREAFLSLYVIVKSFNIHKKIFTTQ